MEIAIFNALAVKLKNVIIRYAALSYAVCKFVKQVLQDLRRLVKAFCLILVASPICG